MARRIAAQAQPDLLILERTFNDKGVLHKQIAVDDIRRTVAFFGSTAGEGGWRVAIVDAVDELNRAGANALLKVLEEPPQRALLLLVSHSAARVLPTLRSRCRILTLRPLADADVAQAVAAATGADANDPHIAAALGRRGWQCRARVVAHGRGRLGCYANRRSTCSIDCRRSTPRRCMRSARRLPERIRSRSTAFVDTVNVWLSRRLHRRRQ